MAIYKKLTLHIIYSKKAKECAIKNDIILTNSNNILHKLNLYIDKQIEEKELCIL